MMNKLFLILLFAVSFISNAQAGVSPLPLDISGNVKFSISRGKINLRVDRLDNPNSNEWRSGDLKFSIWATKKKYSRGRLEGYQILACFSEGIIGGDALTGITCSRPLPRIPIGTYYVIATLAEFDGKQYLISDQVIFPNRLKFIDKLRTSAKQAARAD